MVFWAKVLDSISLEHDRKITQLQTEISIFQADSVRADKFIELAKRYTDFDELTTTMLNEFVEKVIVHEADKTTGKRIQQVDIHLNFIGHFTAPIEEIPLTEEQVEAEQRLDEKRTKERERQRRYRERKREEVAAAKIAV